MDDSSSGSSCPTMEHCISQSKSNQSLSVVPFPSEDRPDCEAVTPCEDLTSEGPSSLPPVQGAGGTSSVRRPMGRRNGIQEKPEEPGEEDMDEPINAYLCSLHKDSVAKWAQSDDDDDESMDNWEQETITKTVWEMYYFLKTIKVCLDRPKNVEDDNTVLPGSPQEEDVDDSVLPGSPQEEDNKPKNDEDDDSLFPDSPQEEDVDDTVLPGSPQEEDNKPKNVEDDDTVLPDSPQEEDVAYSVLPGSPQKEDVDDTVLPDPPQKEDVQPSSSISSHMDQFSPEEHEACQDLPKCQRAENGDPKQCPGLEEDEIVEMESQESGTAESFPVSALQSEEWDMPSDKQGTSCMNFRGFFHWFRKRVVSSLPGRKRREKAKKVPSCWR
ncbi:uncharacterized protein C12orf71 homolog [Urocitellus parryii]